jgi:hypothetical protein
MLFKQCCAINCRWRPPSFHAKTTHQKPDGFMQNQKANWEIDFFVAVVKNEITPSISLFQQNIIPNMRVGGYIFGESARRHHR